MDVYNYNSGSLTTLSTIYQSDTYINSNTYPIRTIEKDGKKIQQYAATGLNKNNITVKKNFVNKTKTLSVVVEGKFKDEVTEYENNLNISLNVDYSIYNKVTWKIEDGLLTVTMYEIKNEEPDVIVREE